jgi:rubrerythrin
VTAPIDVIKTGMSTELWGQRFYREAAERTQSPEGKGVFQTLVEEEGHHLDILRGQYAALTNNSEWVTVEEASALAASVDPKAIFPEAEAAESLIPADATDEQALLMAMDFERRGYTLYAQAADDAESDQERTLWNYLAQAEDAHYSYLQTSYDYLVSNGVWYFDDRERPFFEG